MDKAFIFWENLLCMMYIYIQLKLKEYVYGLFQDPSTYNPDEMLSYGPLTLQTCAKNWLYFETLVQLQPDSLNNWHSC